LVYFVGVKTSLASMAKKEEVRNVSTVASATGEWRSLVLGGCAIVLAVVEVVAKAEAIHENICWREMRSTVNQCCY
jgi:hypothetical protein